MGIEVSRRHRHGPLAAATVVTAKLVDISARAAAVSNKRRAKTTYDPDFVFTAERVSDVFVCGSDRALVAEYVAAVGGESALVTCAEIAASTSSLAAVVRQPAAVRRGAVRSAVRRTVVAPPRPRSPFPGAPISHCALGGARFFL